MTNDIYYITHPFETIALPDYTAISSFLNDNYGFNPQKYAQTFCKRRIVYSMQKNKVSNTTELINRLKDTDFYENFLYDFTGNRIELFRDTFVWKNILKALIQHIDIRNNFNVWIPNCENGEELFSFLALIHQYGLIEKCSLTVSSISKKRIEQIQKGLIERTTENIDLENFTKLEFTNAFSYFFTKKDTALQFNTELFAKVHFINEDPINHNSKDAYNFILFRNSMIFYGQEYQNSLFQIILNSLKVDGLSIIGLNEQIPNNFVQSFNCINEQNKLYQKVNE